MTIFYLAKRIDSRETIASPKTSTMCHIGKGSAQQIRSTAGFEMGMISLIIFELLLKLSLSIILQDYVNYLSVGRKSLDMNEDYITDNYIARSFAFA